MALFGNVPGDTSLQREIILTIDDFRKGSTGPSDVTIGTTPTVPALHFDATAELLIVQVHMPHEWDQGNVTLMLDVILSATETNGDTLDLTIDYVATIAQSTGKGPGKTSTQLTPSLTVTTANGLAVGDHYSMEITIAAADGTNPLASAHMLIFEFHLTNTTNVGEFNFLGGCIQYVATH